MVPGFGIRLAWQRCPVPVLRSFGIAIVDARMRDLPYGHRAPPPIRPRAHPCHRQGGRSRSRALIREFDSTRPAAETSWSADFCGGFADGGVDVAGFDVEFLGDVLFG